MARLLIISRSLALRMRLTDLHEVEERSADELEQHLPEVGGYDVLVLDVGDPVLAVNTVNSLREDEQAIPVMLISGYQPEWEQVEAQQVEGVHVVPLPITRQALVQGVAVLMGEDPSLIHVEPTGAIPIISAEEEFDEPSIEDDETAGAPEASAASPEPAETSVAQSPADAAAAKAVQHAAAQARLVTGRNAAEQAGQATRPGQPVPNPPAGQNQPDAPQPGSPGQQPGSQGQERLPVEGDGTQVKRGTGPQHDRARRPGSRPQTEAIEVIESQVAGLSYSTPVARPFAEQPPTGQFPLNRTPVREPGRPSRWRSNPPPETGSLPADNSNIASNLAAGRRLQRLGDRPRKLQRRANAPDNTPRTPGRGLVTDPLGPRTDPYGFPVSALERRLDAEAAALVTARSATGEGETALRTGDLIRMLQERAGELYGVSDTSQVLADDVIERASADAAAILVPDGQIWRVSGGVGLRPLERRLELAESHWLIAEIGSAGRAVLIDDTDIVRQQLAGAPLAAWRHLLAVPVPDVRVIVVLARGEKGGAFTDRDLAVVYTPVREAAALLAQAIETRRLARALAPLREPEPETGR